MARNWGDVREVLEDIERDRLEEKLKKLDDNLTIASQLPTTDPEAVAAHEAENRYYEHLLMLIEAGLVQGVAGAAVGSMAGSAVYDALTDDKKEEVATPVQAPQPAPQVP